MKQLRLARKAGGLIIARSGLELLVESESSTTVWDGFTPRQVPMSSAGARILIRDRKRGVVVEKITYLPDMGRRETAEWPNAWCFQLLNGNSIYRESAKHKLESFGFDSSIIDALYPIAGKGVPKQGPWNGGRPIATHATRVKKVSGPLTPANINGELH